MPSEEGPGGPPQAGEPPLKAAPRYAEPPPIAKGVAFFVVGLVVLHFAMTFLWNAPQNPVKDSIGGQVSGYMRPFFEQNWSLFAPNPVNAEDELLVRAQVVDSETGQTRTTDWANPTQLEWRLVLHNPAPSRASRLTSNLHRRVNTAWRRLNDRQKKIVAGDYEFMSDWGPLAEDLIAAQDGQTSAVVAGIVRADRVATGYATQYARATWGDGIRAVQFQLRRTPVPRWDVRKEPVPDEPSFIARDFGWRPVLVNDGQEESLFKSALEGFGG